MQRLYVRSQAPLRDWLSQPLHTSDALLLLLSPQPVTAKVAVTNATQKSLFNLIVPSPFNEAPSYTVW